MLLLSGLLLRYAGLHENIQLHPDERNIALWMDRMHMSNSLRPQTYAGGFFVLADAARKTTEWVDQNLFRRWAYFINNTDELRTPHLDPVAFGRHINIWLGALSILLAAWLAGRVARSRAAVLTAAALMAFAAFPIEHAHYLESDMAMLAALSLSLLLITRFLATRRIRDWIPAAALAGFAAGTKFPLALLVLPLMAALLAGNDRPRPLRRTGLLLALAAVFVPAGFVVATPDALHFAHFLAGMKTAGAAVYAETAEILGPAAGKPFARQCMNAANLCRFAQTLRPGWLLLAALGIPLCFARRFRAFWPVTVLFPALMLAYIVFQAPWSRSQEFMALLPNFCLWAALPIAALWRAPHSRAKKSAALALCALATLPVLQTGVALSSQFAWEDTRRLANRTLKTSFPTDQPLVAELYSAPAEEGVSARIFPISEYAMDASPYLAASNPCAYFLLNANFHSRGLRDPRTLALFPPFAENMADLQANGRCLATWSSLDSPAPQPYFRAPRIELWWRSAGQSPPQADLGIDLPRPALVKDEGRSTFFQGDLRAGPRIALPIDRHQREIALGGPGRLEGPVFLVFSTRERAATVQTKGFGQTRRLALGPYDAGAIPLERPWWNPRWSRYERVVVRSETGGPTLTYLPCFLQVAFDPIEAASLLLDEGHRGQAIELLRRHDALGKAGPFWRALAGEADAVPGAAALLARWEHWIAADASPPPPVCSGGIPLSIWQDFARIHLVEKGQPCILPLSFAQADHAGRRTSSWAQFLPVFGVPQTLSMSLGRQLDAFGHANFSGPVFLDADGRTEIGRFDFPDFPESGRGETNWTHSGSALPRNVALSFRARSGGTLRIEEAQFTWSWRDMLALRAAQLRCALSEEPAPNALRYGDWLAVRECRLEGGQARLVFEALQNGVPRLSVQLRILRRGKWRPREAVPFVDSGKPWRRGERKTVLLPLEEDLELDRVGIALFTDVPWHASVLPFAGAPDKRPFPTLAELLQTP